LFVEFFLHYLCVGDPIVVFGLTEHEITSDHQATLKITTLSGNTREVPVSISGNVSAGSMVGVLASTALVSDVEKDLEARAITDSDAKALILPLALRYSLVTRYTSLVAQETREDPTEGTMEVREINTLLMEERARETSEAQTTRELLAQARIQQDDIRTLSRISSTVSEMRSLGAAAPMRMRGSLGSAKQKKSSAFGSGLLSSLGNAVGSVKDSIGNALTFNNRMYGAATETQKAAYISPILSKRLSSPEKSRAEEAPIRSKEKEAPRKRREKEEEKEEKKESVASARFNAAADFGDDVDEADEELSELGLQMDLGEPLSKLAGASESTLASYSAPPPPPPAQSAPSPFLLGAVAPVPPSRAPAAASFSSSLASFASPAAPLPAAPPREDPFKRPLDRFIVLQQASGSWSLSEAFLKEIHLTLPSIEANFGPDVQQGGWFRDVCATALALVYLGMTFAENQEEWSLLRDKALRWMKKELLNNNSNETVDALLQKAKFCFV